MVIIKIMIALVYHSQLFEILDSSTSSFSLPHLLLLLPDAAAPMANLPPLPPLPPTLPSFSPSNSLLLPAAGAPLLLLLLPPPPPPLLLSTLLLISFLA